MMRIDLFKKRLRCLVLPAIMFLTIGGSAMARAADLDGRLQQLIGQYEQIQTVNLIAKAHSTDYLSVIEPCGPKTLICNVYFSYTADYEKYNILYKDDLLDSGPSWVRYAYNGERFQDISLLDGNMGYQKADSDGLTLGIDNPFFEAVRFLSQANDSNITYAIKLTYMQNPSTLKKLLSKVTWMPSTISNSEEVAILPGPGTIEGQPFEYRIYFGNKINYLPTRIEMRFSNPSRHDLMWGIDIQDYGSSIVAGKPFYWAKSMELTDYVGDQKLIDRHTNVVSCQVNQPVNQNDFTIDFKLARNVWDMDTHRLVYQNNTSMSQDPVSADIRTAWENAGAESGWMTQEGEWEPLDVGQSDDVPAFRIKHWNQDVISQLPSPDQRFGLDLQNANITDSGLKELSGFTQLQMLNLSGTHVTDTDLKDLNGLMHLSDLDLSDTDITDTGMAEIDSFSRLRYLDLTGTQVTDAGLKKLKCLTNLLFLGLDDTFVTEAGMAEFKKVSPYVQFSH